jgi:acyl-CoA synthetase (AMP-forming)/AMP-acid ligase II
VLDTGQIVDGAGTEIAGEGSGRLFVSGGSVARCYWRNPLKTAATMLGDWLDTGDTFRRDADGHYFLSTMT